MTDLQKNTVIIIAGPTASGKTSIAVELAEQLGTEIISADSRQCYREMKIGVARPSEAELNRVKHHFIASHAVTEELNAGSFENYAVSCAEQIFKNNPVAVMVGGTGLYIKAFCEGIDPMPQIEPAIRAHIIAEYEKKGLIWLQRELQEKDPAFWEIAEQQNPQRLMRALEVLNGTGKSIREFRTSFKKERPFNILKIGWGLSKENLHKNIDQRVDRMMEEGLVKEVESLLPFREANALQTVGYREIFAYIDGETSLDVAVNHIKKNTRQYAKRQMTWFTKDKEIIWMEAEKTGVQEILSQLPV